MYMSARTSEGATTLSGAEERLVVDSRSLNAVVAQLAISEKLALKTYLQVELNDYLQEQMESELFEGVDEMEKSQFLGDFFHWMRNVHASQKGRRHDFGGEG